MADTNKGGNVREKALETATAARQTAQEALSSAGQKVQETASNLGHRAQEFASAAQERTEGALSSVGQSMTSLAGTIRERAPHEGPLGTAASTVANQLQSGGRYLQEHGLGDMADDVGGLIRHYPLQSLLVAFGVGWLIGMSSRR
jgi:hypothetical protein